ncbi:MAG: agmatine deiminase family protein [Planctomycetota bacterium]
MNKRLRKLAIAILAAFLLITYARPAQSQISSYMPEESAPHEGTWLQWPHHYTYGVRFRNEVESSWIEMTRVLVQSENVHIIAYNRSERRRIRNVLRRAGVPLARVDFLIRPTDDFWVRDNGPIFVRDLTHGDIVVADWGFNGWGLDAPYMKDNTVPVGVANQRDFPRMNLNDLIIEGGAIEVDGNGVLMATRSSILEPDRNPGWTQNDVEEYLTGILGVTKFVWLDGRDGGTEDITDTHIDGFARFGRPDTIVTMNRRDLRYWGLSNRDINRLYSTRDVSGKRYRRVHLPLTRNNVRTTYGYNTGFKGSYVNFYVSNGHVLMPTYGDPNDAVAKQILQTAFPDRTVVGIDFRNAYLYGGMIHCVTQQQPVE